MKALIANRSLLTRVPNMLLSRSLGAGVSVQEVLKPSLYANEVLVKVYATALNPIDFKFIDFIAPSGSRTGCDFTGIISEVRESASQTWKVGDRVAGFVQGGVSVECGAFADFVKTEEDLTWRIPERVTNEDAATFGVSTVTAMQALNHNLSVPWLKKLIKARETPGTLS